MSVKEETLEGTLIEIPMTFGDYDYIRTIASGCRSVVVLARDRIKKRYVACKFVSRDDLSHSRKMRYFEEELRIMQRLKFKYIIETYEIIYLNKCIVAVTEYCEKGDLYSYIQAHGPLIAYQMRHIFKQIVMAVQFLHERNIAHRDIKPENVFIDIDFNVKLGDFGLSRETCKDNLCSTICGTLIYLAPEVFSGEHYDPKKTDIWSLGILLFTMSTKMLPWTDDNPKQLMKEINNGIINVPPNVPGIIERLILECTMVDPNKRPSCQELLRSKWIATGSSIAYETSINIPCSATVNSNSLKRSAVQILKNPIKCVYSERHKVALSPLV